MHIITKKITSNLDNIYNSAYLSNRKLMIFDIETTGFSRQNEITYMIGCILKTDNIYDYHNIFASKPSSEEKILKHFFDMLEKIDCIITFNGNNFDIPFLLARANKYNIKSKISHIETIDIYELLRPFRTGLGLPNLKLNTIQNKLGYKREDEYSGGDLIKIYKDYVRNPYVPYYELLLLHNKEDVEGMINLLPLIDTSSLLSNIVNNYQIQFIESRIYEDRAVILYKLPSKSPLDFKLTSKSSAELILEQNTNTAKLVIPLCKGEKKYFFDNYKDYMYIMEKAEVMHKSVASFISSDKKRRAKKAECYVSKEGIFIPIFAPDISSRTDIRIFKDSLNSKDNYAIVSPDLKNDFYIDQIIGFIRQYLV